jgi:Mg2+ and Co2+ transporter CorA
MRQIIEQTRERDESSGSSASFEQIARDIVDSKKMLTEEINPEINIIRDNKERLKTKLLSNIDKSKTEVVKLSNVLKTEIILKEVHQVSSLI